jgi:hypothetical protein
VALLIPVILPPGRARLATNPDPTGSPTDTITIGIVDVALRTATSAGVDHATNDIDITIDEFSYDIGILFEGTSRRVNGDGQVLPFDVAAFTHSIAERAQHGGR